MSVELHARGIVGPEQVRYQPTRATVKRLREVARLHRDRLAQRELFQLAAWVLRHADGEQTSVSHSL